VGIRWSLRSATSWAPRGHLVGWDQWAVGTVVADPAVSGSATGAATVTAAIGRSRRAGAAGTAVVERDRDAGQTRLVAEVDGRPLVVSVDDEAAAVTRITLGDDVLVERGPRLELFRAAVDNDGLKLAVGSDDPWQFEQFARPLFRWVAAGLADPQRRGVRVTPQRARRGSPGSDGGAAAVRLATDLVLADDVVVRHTTTVTLGPDGQVRFDEAVRIPVVLDDLPRVGVSLEVPAVLGSLRWLGLGPDENYPDRCASSVVGRFGCSVDDTYVPYLMPQHHGTRGGLRWLTLTAEEGSTRRGGRAGVPGVRIAPVAAGGSSQWFSARRLTDADLWGAVDWTALPDAGDLARRPVTVNLDAALRGLGTASCGPDTAEAFRVRAGWHRWSWSLQPEW